MPRPPPTRCATSFRYSSENAALSGQLVQADAGKTPISGRTLTLSLGGDSCTGTTDSNGNANCTVAISGAVGPQPVSASFAGDSDYQSSSDTGKTAMVLGQLSVAGTPNIAVNATSTNGATVTYSEPAATSTPAGGPAPTVSCSPAPGSTFAIGTTTVTCTASDPDDYPGTATAEFTVTVHGPPTVSITTPSSGATYTVAEAVTADYACAEGTDGPGLVSCTGSVANGSALDTSAPGSASFTVTATSSDGLRSSQTVVYTVAPGSAPSSSVGTSIPAPVSTRVLLSAWKWLPTPGRAWIKADLLRSDTRRPLAGKLISFTVGPLRLCHAVSGRSGAASCIFKIDPATLGDLLKMPTKAAFKGGNGFLASRATAVPGLEAAKLVIARIVRTRPASRCKAGRRTGTRRACRWSVSISGRLTPGATGWLTIVLVPRRKLRASSLAPITVVLRAGFQWKARRILLPAKAAQATFLATTVSYSGDAAHAPATIHESVTLTAGQHRPNTRIAQPTTG